MCHGDFSNCYVLDQCKVKLKEVCLKHHCHCCFCMFLLKDAKGTLYWTFFFWLYQGFQRMMLLKKVVCRVVLNWPHTCRLCTFKLMDPYSRFCSSNLVYTSPTKLLRPNPPTEIPMYIIRCKLFHVNHDGDTFIWQSDTIEMEFRVTAISMKIPNLHTRYICPTCASIGTAGWDVWRQSQEEGCQCQTKHLRSIMANPLVKVFLGQK